MISKEVLKKMYSKEVDDDKDYPTIYHKFNGMFTKEGIVRSISIEITEFTKDILDSKYYLFLWECIEFDNPQIGDYDNRFDDTILFNDREELKKEIAWIESFNDYYMETSTKAIVEDILNYLNIK